MFLNAWTYNQMLFQQLHLYPQQLKPSSCSVLFVNVAYISNRGTSTDCCKLTTVEVVVTSLPLYKLHLRPSSQLTPDQPTIDTRNYCH